MTTENLEVKFGVTDTGASEAADSFIKRLALMSQDTSMLTDLAKGMAVGFLEAFTGISAQAETADKHVKELGEDLEKAGEKSHGMVGGLAETLEGVEGIHRKVGELAELFAGAFALEQIHQFAEAHAQAAEKIEAESQKVGVSTDAIQQWNTVAALSGVNSDAFVQALGHLELAMVRANNPTSEQAKAFAQLGINASAARDPQELLISIADKFQGMDDGPKKFAIATDLMGRSGADLVPVLNKGAEGIAEMTQKGQEYGDIMTESMINRASQVGEALSTSNLAFHGLSNILFDAVAPSIQIVAEGFNDMVKSMVESYNSGGAVKTVLDGIALAFKGLIIVIVATVSTFYILFEVANGLVWGFQGVVYDAFEIIKTSILVLIDSFETLGAVIRDSLTLNWGQIAGDVRSGLDQVNAEIRAGTDNMRSTGGQMFDFAGQAFGRGQAAKDWTQEFVDKLKNGVTGKETAPPKPVNMDTSGLGGKSGGEGPSAVQKWEEQLHEQEILSGEYFKDQTASELAFWQSKLALTTQGSKDWIEVQGKIYELSKKQAQENYQQQIASLDQQIQGQRDNFTAQAALEQQKVDLVGRTYGLQSSQYQNALREQERMNQQHQDEMVQIELRGMQQRESIEKGHEQAQAASDKALADAQLELVRTAQQNGIIGREQAAAQENAIAQQEYAREAQLQENLYNLQMESLVAQLQIPGLRLAEQERIATAMETAEAQHQDRMLALQTQQATLNLQAQTRSAQAVHDVWTSRLTPVTQAFTSMANSMISGTTSLRSAILTAGSQILQSVNTWIMKWVQDHVVAQQTMTASTAAAATEQTAIKGAQTATGLALNATSATAEITTHAAVAAAGALRAVSSIPVIGPFIAPAIAAGILSLAMGFIGKIASAEGGWDQVPMDGMKTELHKDEMVLPASIASPLRTVISGVQSWGLGTTGMGTRPQASNDQDSGHLSNVMRKEGDVHLHLTAIDTQSGAQFLDKNRAKIASALRQAYREGNR